MDHIQSGGSFFDGCIKTYGAATRHMTEVWESVTGEPMGTLSGYPKDRFREALGYFVRAMRDSNGIKLQEVLRAATKGDEALTSLIEDSFDAPNDPPPPDVDDVPPSMFKRAIWDEALERAGDKAVDVDLDVFLRSVVARVVNGMGWEGRINVGKNRHFPRMFQWLREVHEETVTDDGVGFRLLNRSSTGRVAAYPTSPHALKVRLDGRWL